MASMPLRMRLTSTSRSALDWPETSTGSGRRPREQPHGDARALRHGDEVRLDELDGVGDGDVEVEDGERHVLRRPGESRSRFSSSAASSAPFWMDRSPLRSWPCRGALVDLPEHQLDAAEQHREDVVEVVDHARPPPC